MQLVYMQCWVYNLTFLTHAGVKKRSYNKEFHLQYYID